MGPPSGGEALHQHHYSFSTVQGADGFPVGALGFTEASAPGSQEGRHSQNFSEGVWKHLRC